MDVHFTYNLNGILVVETTVLATVGRRPKALERRARNAGREGDRAAT